nr:nuclease-related domain-containing protein [Neobacillus sp. Marseille-Q6967]
MSYKPRFESDELKILRSLNTRWELPVENKKRYIYLEKGYAGEVLFDSMTERLKNDLHILNDLQLEVNNSSFQIDSLIISQDTLFPCEVKNYEGDYYYKDNKFYTMSGIEILNPLD